MKSTADGSVFRAPLCCDTGVAMRGGRDQGRSSVGVRAVRIAAFSSD